LEISAISTNFRHNEQIRISPIFLIDADDNKVGSTSTAEALRRAREIHTSHDETSTQPAA